MKRRQFKTIHRLTFFATISQQLSLSFRSEGDVEFVLRIGDPSQGVPLAFPYLVNYLENDNTDLSVFV